MFAGGAGATKKGDGSRIGRSQPQYYRLQKQKNSRNPYFDGQVADVETGPHMVLGYICAMVPAGEGAKRHPLSIGHKALLYLSEQPRGGHMQQIPTSALSDTIGLGRDTERWSRGSQYPAFRAWEQAGPCARSQPESKRVDSSYSVRGSGSHQT